MANRVDYEIKLEAVTKILSGKEGIRATARRLGCGKSSVAAWVRNYKSMGSAGLMYDPHREGYPEELKKRAVRDYLNHCGSLAAICRKYHIRSTQRVSDWIKVYNSHEELPSSPTSSSSLRRSEGPRMTTKQRKTTFEERVEIVRACIDNHYNYKATAEKFGVSYTQVNSWVHKYEKGGTQQLEDRRGRRTPESEMTPEQLAQAEIRLLKARNKYLEMENFLLKKLKELRGA